MAQAKMKIMISHAYDEKELAEAWKKLLETISMYAVVVWFSSDLRGKGGMTPGAGWREDLERELLTNNLFLAIQTPASASHTWIVWECGVAHGIHVSEAAGEVPRDHGVIPIVYAMKRSDLSNPLNSYQIYEGEDPVQVRQLCEYLLSTVGLEPDNYIFDKALTTYRETIAAFHLRQQISVGQMNTWRERFQQLVNTGRTSEIPPMRLRMYASLVTPFEPIEPTIHEMLSQLFLDQGHYAEAIQEVDYALRLLKNDTDLLYRKALAEVELQNLQSAEETIRLILPLDKKLASDPQIASLEGRIMRERWALTQNSAQLDASIAAYYRAYEADPAQYFPGINAAELLLAKGESARAEQIFRQLLLTCQKDLAEPVVSYWVDFTLGAIHLGLGDVPAAIAAYQRGTQRSPSPPPRDRRSVVKGARRMITARKLPEDVAEQIERLVPIS